MTRELHTGIPRPANDTPGLAGLNVVRPRAGALRALHVDPRRGTGVHWHQSGETQEKALPRSTNAVRKPLGRVKDQVPIRQGSSEVRHPPTRAVSQGLGH